MHHLFGNSRNLQIGMFSQVPHLVHSSVVQRPRILPNLQIRINQKRKYILQNMPIKVVQYPTVAVQKGRNLEHMR